MKLIKRKITTTTITVMLQLQNEMEVKEVSFTTKQPVKNVTQAIKIVKKELELSRRDSFIILSVKQELEEFYMDENYFLKHATGNLVKTTYLKGEE